MADRQQRISPRVAIRLVVAVALLLLSGVVLAIIYFLDQDAKVRTAEAPVLITSAERFLKTSGRQTDTMYRVQFTFTVAGKETTGTDELSWDPRVSDPVKVCYNPSNPAEASLRKIAFQCGRTWLF